MSQVMRVKIQKWGNGLALRIAGLMREIPKLEEVAAVDVEIFEDGFTVKKAKPATQRFPFSESELLKDMTPFNAHGDELARLSPKESGHE